MAIAVEDRAGIADDAFARISAALAEHSSIKRALDWFATQVPPLTPADVVVQDEFSHDVLVPYPGGLWLAYDTS